MFKVWLICNNHKTDLSNIYLILKSYCTDFLCRILFLIVNLLLFACSTGILIFWHFLLPSDCFLLMLYKEFVSIFFCLWQKITSSLLIRCTVKQPPVCFICFLLSAPPPFSLWLSLVAGLFLLSPAMMAPHLAVGTMRNDKMGEPCFYLMGQNQTTVCSQKSVPLHSPCHRFPFSYIHPFFQPIPPCIPLCVRVGVKTCWHCIQALSASFNPCYSTSVCIWYPYPCASFRPDIY